MERRFGLRHFPVQPMSQPIVELAGGFVVASLTLAEEFASALKLRGSRKRLFELANELQQLL